MSGTTIRPESIRNLFAPSRTVPASNVLGARGADLTRLVGSQRRTEENTNSISRHSEATLRFMGQSTRALQTMARNTSLLIGNGNRAVAILRAMHMSTDNHQKEQASREIRLLTITREGFEKLTRETRRGGISAADVGLAALATRLSGMGRAAVGVITAPIGLLGSAVRSAGRGLASIAAIARTGLGAPISALSRYLSGAATAARATTGSVGRLGAGLAFLGRSVSGIARGASAAFITPVIGAVAGIFGRTGIFASAASVIGRVGGALGLGAVAGGAGRLLSGLGGMIAKIAWPITAIIGIIDAVKGWNEADKDFNKAAGTATLTEKISSAVGRVLDGLTFGLTGWISEQFGFERTSHLLKAAGDKIEKGIKALHDALPTWEQVKEFMTGGAEIFSLQGITGILTAPLRLAVRAGDWLAAQVPTWAQVRSLFEGEGWSITTESVLKILTKPFHLAVDAVKWLYDKIPTWASVEAALHSLPEGERVSDLLKMLTSPFRMAADVVKWLYEKLPTLEQVRTNIDGLMDGLATVRDTITSPFRVAGQVVDWLTEKLPTWDDVKNSLPSLSNIWDGFARRVTSVVGDVQSWIEDSVADIGYAARRQIQSGSTQRGHLERTERLAGGGDVGQMAQELMRQGATPQQVEAQLRDTIGLSGASSDTRQQALRALRGWQQSGGAQGLALQGAQVRQETTAQAVTAAEGGLTRAQEDRAGYQQQIDQATERQGARRTERTDLQQQMEQLRAARPGYGAPREERQRYAQALQEREDRVRSLQMEDRADERTIAEARRGVDAYSEVIAKSAEDLEKARAANEKATQEVTKLAEALEKLREVVPAPRPIGIPVPPVVDPITGSPIANAFGNVIHRGRVVPFALGGILTEPATFPMAGGQTGLAGEAGPEAIMPVARMADGRMGVQAQVSMQGVERGLQEVVTATREGTQQVVQSLREASGATPGGSRPAASAGVAVPAAAATGAGIGGLFSRSQSYFGGSQMGQGAPAGISTSAGTIPPRPSPIITPAAASVAAATGSGVTPGMPGTPMLAPVGLRSGAVSVPRPGQRGAPDEGTLGAIAAASRATGIDFGYMMAMAGQESSFNPNARAGTSSATGLYQFIDGTWADMVRKHGSTHGLTMDGRTDPRQASIAAGLYSQENARQIERTTGRTANPTDLYIGHFLGGGGASKFLGGMQNDPNQRADALVTPGAAQANRNIFYNRETGQARSAKEVYDLFQKKIGEKAEAYKQQYGEQAAGLAGGPLPGAVAARSVVPGTPAAGAAAVVGSATYTGPSVGELARQMAATNDPAELERLQAQMVVASRAAREAREASIPAAARPPGTPAGTPALPGTAAAASILPATPAATSVPGAQTASYTGASVSEIARQISTTTDPEELSRLQAQMVVASRAAREAREAGMPAVPGLTAAAAGAAAGAAGAAGRPSPTTTAAMIAAIRGGTVDTATMTPEQAAMGGLTRQSGYFGGAAERGRLATGQRTEVPQDLRDALTRRQGAATPVTPDVEAAPRPQPPPAGAGQQTAPATPGAAQAPVAPGVGGRPSVASIPVMDDLQMLLLTSFALNN